MGKLNIAHHKSYHPYRRDNIERVRRDEEEARLQEQAKEGKIMLADAEARIELLRQRAGLSKSQSKAQKEKEEDIPQVGPSSLVSGGHINLFEDIEKQAMVVAIKTTGKQAQKPNEQGIPLAPSEKDLKPWYSNRDPERKGESEDDRRLRDLTRKSIHDPLTSINQQLAARSPSDTKSSITSSHQRSSVSRRTSTSTPSTESQTSQVAERLSRESSERQRALELIRRKKREMEGSMTPSTVHGGIDDRPGYGDQFNRREVEEAHKSWERRWERNDGRSHPPRRR